MMYAIKLPDPVTALLLSPGQQQMEMTLLSCRLSTACVSCCG